MTRPADAVVSAVAPDLDVRQAFERWAAAECSQWLHGTFMERDGSGYKGARAHCAWSAWQARAALSADGRAVAPPAIDLLTLRGWQPIETAPKTKLSDDGTRITEAIYLLGYCPHADAVDLESCVCVVWWEPLMNKGKGMWYGEGSYELHPTHWMRLPAPPEADRTGTAGATARTASPKEPT